MIIDAREIPDAKVLSADLCIVGAGAAGIAMALQFIDTKLEVLVLESGGEGAEPDAQALYEGTVADERLHSPPHRYRERRFGGTTTIWGGRCMPFDAIDFEARSYVPSSGWPFDYQSLLPYYERANRVCEAGEFSYSAEQALGDRDRPIIEGFEGDYFTSNTLERFSCPTDFGARYGHKLRAAKNITVLLHANVTNVQLRADGHRVESLEIQTLGGKRLRACSSHFVLAAGGLEVCAPAARKPRCAAPGNRQRARFGRPLLHVSSGGNDRIDQDLASFGCSPSRLPAVKRRDLLSAPFCAQAASPACPAAR